MTPKLTLQELEEQNIKPSWYNSYNYNEIVNQIKQMIITMFKKDENTKVWGFKEIRYDKISIHYLSEFKELFPQTKVILHIRENVDSQSQSGWHKTNPYAIQELKKLNQYFIDFSNKNSEWCYLFTFEQMLDKTNIENMFCFLNHQDVYDEKKIESILNNNLTD